MTDPGLLQNPLWYYIKKFRKSFSLGMFYLLVTNILDAIYPLFLAMIIDRVAAKLGFVSLLGPLAAFLATMAGLAVSRYLWRVYFGNYHTHAAEDLRNLLMAHLLKLTPGFYQRNQLGELMSLIVNDVQSFRQSIGSAVLILVDGAVMVAIILPIMLMMNAEWTWKTLIFLPVVPLMINALMKAIYKKSKEVQDNLSELSGFSQESVTGIRVIKGFAVETERSRDYAKLSGQYQTANVELALIDSLWSPIMYFGMASGTVILLFIGLDDVMTGVVSLGTLVAFQRYISKMIWPVTALGMGLSQYKKGMAAFDRIKAVLLEKPDVTFAGLAGGVSKFESLAIRNLNFTYSGAAEPALTSVDLELKPGEKIGITGPVGSGKTTLLNVLLGFYALGPGQVLINGKDLFDWDEEKLRQIFTLIPQDVFLFSDTVRNNIRYALAEDHPLQITPAIGDAPVDVAERMLDRVQILDEMRALPGGLEATLGERGINLSGGQKQRLALARGLVRPSSLILMDDVLSAVDYKTEEKILNELASMNTSCLIVSHRIAALRHCDRILVLNKGRVEAVGTFAEVLANSAFFRELNEIQGSAR
jgi:ATP-binding cassette subfamily B multidrug efflux pump